MEVPKVRDYYVGKLRDILERMARVSMTGNIDGLQRLVTDVEQPIKEKNPDVLLFFESRPDNHIPCACPMASYSYWLLYNSGRGRLPVIGGKVMQQWESKHGPIRTGHLPRACILPVLKTIEGENPTYARFAKEQGEMVSKVISPIFGEQELEESVLLYDLVRMQCTES